MLLGLGGGEEAEVEEEEVKAWVVVGSRRRRQRRGRARRKVGEGPVGGLGVIYEGLGQQAAGGTMFHRAVG